MKLSDYIFEYIKEKGIDTVFTVSGGGCMHLIDSLGKSGLRYICNHHEQACAMAAEAYFRTSGKPGCILVTTGPGGTNAITGVLCAYQDSIPMIVLSVRFLVSRCL
jgi:acetolactate synthase-1/2/3 large subunit